jgi:hypothetical protein
MFLNVFVLFGIRTEPSAADKKTEVKRKTYALLLAILPTASISIKCISIKFIIVAYFAGTSLTS